MKNSIDKISRNSQKFNSISKRILSIKIDIEDISNEIDDSLNSLEQNPDKLNTIINKIDKINNLLRKHSLNSVNELSIFRNKLAVKVNTSENIDGEIEHLQKECENLKIKLKSSAINIHEKRKSVIFDLTSQIETVLSELGMVNSKFKIKIE